MRLWTSPVFYLGLILLAGVGALLAAPFVIDWGSYRSNIEAYGRSMTGRDVRISGPIDARLFPWPHLTLSKVEVGNLPGAREPHLLTVERIEADISLADLFGGTLKAARVEVVKPVLSAERLASGRWTFDLDKSELLADSWIAEHVKFDAVTVRDGSIRVIDQCRGGEQAIERVDAVLSAPALAGPWRVRGTVERGGLPYEVALNTSSWKPGKEFKFGFRVAPADGSGFIFSFDGGQAEDVTKGAIRLEPAIAPDGRVDREGKVKPMVLKAALRAKASEIRLDNVEIAPVEAADEAEGSNLLTGSALIRFCPTIELSADLKGPRLDMDELLGARARDLLRHGVPLRLIQDLAAALPEGVTAKASIRTGVLVADGEVLKDAVLKAEAGEGRLKIEELKATLPGQTEGLFSGLFVSGETGPQLVGDISLDSRNLRDFVAWTAPQTALALKPYWTGSRGHLKLKGQVDLVESEFRLTQSEFELDRARGTAYISARYGSESGANIGIDANVIDLDQYAPAGVGATPLAAGSLPGLEQILLELVKPRNLEVLLNTPELKLNGVAAKDVALDVVLGESGFDLRRLDIGDVGQSKLMMAGLVKQGIGGPQGSLGVTVEARDPRPLLRLFGIIPQEGVEQAWAGALGETKLDATAELSSDAGKPGLLLRAQGRSGVYSVDGEGTLSGDLDWRKAEIGVSGEIASTGSDAMAALAGLKPVVGSDLPGRLHVEASGSLAQGLILNLEGALYGASLTFNTKLQEKTGALTWDGHAAVRTEKAGPLFRAVGLAQAPEGVFSAEAQLVNAEGSLQFAELKGLFAGAGFSGNVSVDRGRSFKGDIAVGRLRLADVMGLAFLPWNGKTASAETPLLKALPFGFTGELSVTPQSMTLIDGVDLPEAQLEIKGGADAVKVFVYGKTADNRSASLEVLSSPKGEGRAVKGRITLPLDAGRYLKFASGAPAVTGQAVIDAAFSGEGRSAAGVLAGLQGSGTYTVTAGRLVGLAPAAFLEKALAAKSAAEVIAALPLLTGGAGVDFERIEGTLTVANGAAAFLPTTIKTPAADIVVKPVMETATGDVDIGMVVTLHGKDILPSVEVGLSGPPDRLERTVDASGLVADLGFKILQASIAELEKARLEEERIAAEAERQRQEDAARVEAWESHRVEMTSRRRELSIHRKLALQAAALAEAEAIRVAEEAQRAAEDAKRAEEERVRLAEAEAIRVAEEAQRAAEDAKRAEVDRARLAEQEAKREEAEAIRVRVAELAETEDELARSAGQARIFQLLRLAKVEEPQAFPPWAGPLADTLAATSLGDVPIPRPRPKFNAAKADPRDGKRARKAGGEKPGLPIKLVAPKKKPKKPASSEAEGLH